MASQKAISANDYKDAGGTIFGAGNFTSGNITNDHSLMENVPKDKADKYGSTVVDATGQSVGTSGNIGTRRPIPAGTFKYNSASNQWIMQAGNIATTINNITSTLLTGGAGEFSGNAPKNPATLNTTRRLNELRWTLPSGQVVRGANAGGSSTYANGAGGNADDTAGGSDAVPGEFSYLVTGAVPTQADYKPRTNP